MENQTENNGCSVSGCGCFLLIIAIGIAFNIPVTLDFIARMVGR